MMGYWLSCVSERRLSESDPSAPPLAVLKYSNFPSSFTPPAAAKNSFRRERYQVRGQLFASAYASHSSSHKFLSFTGLMNGWHSGSEPN
jgi:hypothetical protein